jgi:HAD superfamily hydrolase (TIGR01509 family)
MATNTDDEDEITRCFKAVRSLSREGIMSFGMSDDYPIALKCGANMIRIGSRIFGERRKLPKAVFFDQDGVLFNSMPYHAKSWELAMTENGMPFTAEQTYRNEGRTGASVIAEAYKLIHHNEAPQELIEAVYAAKSAHFNRLTGGKLPELIPGIREVLDYLHSKGVQCWVVTGSGQRSLLDKLNDTFPGIFSGIITAYDVKYGKPNPEPYLKAWERSGFDKSECYVVENAPLGVRAGKAAGLFTIAVNTGILSDSELSVEGADKVFPNMDALLQWLKL